MVYKSLAINFCQYSSLIVISESSAHGLVVHVGLVLMKPPEPGHGLAVDNLEDPSVSVEPLDVPGAVGGGLEEGEEELPEVGVVTVLGSPLDAPARLCLRYSVELLAVLVVGSLARREGRTRREGREVLR